MSDPPNADIDADIEVEATARALWAAHFYPGMDTTGLIWPPNEHTYLWCCQMAKEVIQAQRAAREAIRHIQIPPGSSAVDQ